MSQVWNIGGRQYNWNQLQELKKKKLNPLTAVVNFEAPKEEVQKDEPCTLTITEEIIQENPELIDQGVKVGDEMVVEDEAIVEAPTEEVENEEEESLPTNFMKLKALAVSKGMQVDNNTKKPDILQFLEQA